MFGPPNAILINRGKLESEIWLRDIFWIILIWLKDLSAVAVPTGRANKMLISLSTSGKSPEYTIDSFKVGKNSRKSGAVA